MQSETPADPEQFCILVQAMIGPAAGPGEESFDFTVCTPRWIKKAVLDDGFMFGKNCLIVEYYDYGTIRDAINSLCRSIKGSSWREVAEQLGRYGRWEFEDYTEFGHAG
jgi:hypothetical protein